MLIETVSDILPLISLPVLMTMKLLPTFQVMCRVYWVFLLKKLLKHLLIVQRL